MFPQRKDGGEGQQLKVYLRKSPFKLPRTSTKTMLATPCILIGPVRETPFLSRFCATKTIILPRQARDKHRKVEKTEGVFWFCRGLAWRRFAPFCTSAGAQATPSRPLSTLAADRSTKIISTERSSNRMRKNGLISFHYFLLATKHDYCTKTGSGQPHTGGGSEKGMRCLFFGSGLLRTRPWRRCTSPSRGAKNSIFF